MNIQHLHPVRLLVEPKNARLRKAVMVDYEKVATELTTIEKYFYEQLFDESNDFTYRELYCYYLDLYKKTCERLERQKKLKTMALNYTYFHDMMYPMETPKA